MFQVNFRGDARGAKVAPAYAEERDLVGSMIDQEESATGLASIQRQLALDDMLASRVEVSPSDYTDILEERGETYGHFPLSLGAPDKKHMRPGSFYLKSVDELGRRTYIRSFSSTRAPAHGMGYGGSAVTGTD